jgi:signal transduction histidine kinase
VLAPEPVVGVWDQDRLGQVLRNLLDNALKYAPNDSVVEVCVIANVDVDVDVDSVHLAVRDEGVGIAEQALPRVFDRFYRSGAADHHARGFGIGLYVCKLLVEAHGGRIWAESVLGQGTTMRVALPRHAQGAV